MTRDLHNQALKAVIEAIMNHTVGIVIGGTELASGVVINVDDQTYIATARHAVKGARESDLQFMFRPPGTFQHVPRSAGIRKMVGRRATTLPIRRITLSSDQEDLAVLAISSDVAAEYQVSPYAFEKGATSPPFREEVLVVGFPDELVKSVTNPARPGEKGVGALPLAYVTDVSGENFQHDEFRPESHFLLTFDHPWTTWRSRGREG